MQPFLQRQISRLDPILQLDFKIDILLIINHFNLFLINFMCFHFESYILLTQVTEIKNHQVSDLEKSSLSFALSKVPLKLCFWCILSVNKKVYLKMVFLVFTLYTTSRFESDSWS